MVSANVDLVRSIFAAWERGDYSSADGLIARSSTRLPTAPRLVTGSGYRR
jgi:ketosteroid isomerase-like protein